MSWEDIIKYSTKDMMRDEKEKDDLKHSRRSEAQAESDRQTSGEHGVDEHGNYIKELSDFDLNEILWHLAELKDITENAEGKDLDVVSMLQKIIQENESR